MEVLFTTWEEYWKLFDQLILLLSEDNQTALAKEFNDSRQYLNGLTDGWYEFKFAFERTFELNKSKMNQKQFAISNVLLNGINKALKR